jgi:hypothetical protein
LPIGLPIFLFGPPTIPFPATASRASLPSSGALEVERLGPKV